MPVQIHRADQMHRFAVEEHAENAGCDPP
jgi:hypothetical protein